MILEYFFIDTSTRFQAAMPTCLSNASRHTRYNVQYIVSICLIEPQKLREIIIQLSFVAVCGIVLTMILMGVVTGEKDRKCK